MSPKSSKHKIKRKRPGKTGYLLLPLKWLGLSLPSGQTARRGLLTLVIAVFGITTVMYGVGQYYILKHSKEPLVFGTTFIPNYAEYFGLDPKQTMTAMIDELGIKRFRLVSYWDEYEKEPGQYNFEGLDWQFRLAEEKGASVSLAIGLRQPRWPECHMPPWAERLTKAQWQDELKEYIKVVMDRYKNSPALVEYQLENEYFMTVFGICPDHSRERLVDEFDFVKSIDSSHPVVISRSNNWIGLPLGEPRPDKFAISVYKRVWDITFTKRYFEYPLPPWFYASLAGGAELLTGRDMSIHELQTEAWLPPVNSFAMNDINSIDEQNKSMNAERLGKRLDYGAATGMRTIDLWGVEWWYWRKEKAGDPSLWNAAKEKIQSYSSDK
jgi:hypothetical protein